MGDNLFVSFVERVARVAQYARNNYSMWWNGKEYPWDKKRGKFMRWSGGNNPHPEEPGYEESNPLFATSGIFPEKEETKNTDVPKSEQKSEEKPLPPMATNHPTSQKETEPIVAESAEDFQKVVDIVRSKTMSPEAAEREKTKTRDSVAVFRKYITNNIELRDLRNRYRILTQECKKSVGTTRYPSVAKELEEVQTRGKSLRKQTDQLAKLIHSCETNLLDKNREQNLSFLKSAFPDRGGFSFFRPYFKKEALEEFRKLGLEKDAQYVFDVFDIIGKSFNFNPKTPKPPVLVFEKIVPFANNSSNNPAELLESRYDRYVTGDRFTESKPSTIRLSNQKEHRDNLLNRFALNLAEWIDEEVLGLEQMEDNQNWLQRETGDFYTPGFGKYTIPQEKAPFLCIHPDGDSMCLSHPHPHYAKISRPIYSTGVFPTGMQWLSIYPELFAIQSPKHFDQLLKNFRALSARTKKH